MKFILAVLLIAIGTAQALSQEMTRDQAIDALKADIIQLQSVSPQTPYFENTGWADQTTGFPAGNIETVATLPAPLSLKPIPDVNAEEEVRLAVGTTVKFTTDPNSPNWVKVSYTDGTELGYTSTAELQLAGMELVTTTLNTGVGDIITSATEKLIDMAFQLQAKWKGNEYVEITGFSLVMTAPPALELSFALK